MNKDLQALYLSGTYCHRTVADPLAVLILENQPCMSPVSLVFHTVVTVSNWTQKPQMVKIGIRTNHPCQEVFDWVKLVKEVIESWNQNIVKHFLRT